MKRIIIVVATAAALLLPTAVFADDTQTSGPGIGGEADPGPVAPAEPTDEPVEPEPADEPEPVEPIEVPAVEPSVPTGPITVVAPEFNPACEYGGYHLEGVDEYTWTEVDADDAAGNLATSTVTAHPAPGVTLTGQTVWVLEWDICEDETPPAPEPTEPSEPADDPEPVATAQTVEPETVEPAVVEPAASPIVVDQIAPASQTTAATGDKGSAVLGVGIFAAICCVLLAAASGRIR